MRHLSMVCVFVLVSVPCAGSTSLDKRSGTVEAFDEGSEQGRLARQHILFDETNLDKTNGFASKECSDDANGSEHNDRMTTLDLVETVDLCLD